MIGPRSHPVTRRHPASSRGVATLFVLFAIGLTAIVLLGVQSTSFRQAGAGREALATARARWAARGGLEAAIARLAHTVEAGEVPSAYSTQASLSAVSTGELDGARFVVEHVDDGTLSQGPADAHARVNINRMSLEDLMELSGMTEDVAAAILDWIDEDEDVSDLGAEASAYIKADTRYEPRNAPIRSLFELDLIRGIDPVDVRGEDWNLNGVLDPNEDDGDLTFPPDDRDGVLDAGWSALITTESVDEGLAVSGLPRLQLPISAESAVMGRIDGLTPIQARVILRWSQQEGTSVNDFISTPLTSMAAQLNDPTLPAQAVVNLSDAQLRALIDEATMASPDDGPAPGRLNINTCSRESLRLVSVFRGPQGSGAADLLMFSRDANGGFTHIMDLSSLLNPQQIATVAQDLDVQSNAYVVTSRGVDINTGIESEIVATIERTALPIVITEMHTR